MHDDQTEERPSKSARKRELAALLDLAGQMTALSDQELRRLGVDEALRAAIGLVRPMRASGARNRQLKHCLKFMDPAALVEVGHYLESRQSQQVAANREFHALEQWRDRLVDEGDAALEALFEAHPDLDRQHLRRLVRDAIREREAGRPTASARKIFRYLRECLIDRAEKK